MKRWLVYHCGFEISIQRYRCSNCSILGSYQVWKHEWQRHRRLFKHACRILSYGPDCIGDWIWELDGHNLLFDQFKWGGVTLSPICNHEDRNFNNSIEALEYLHQLSVGSNDYPLVHELYSFLWCYRTPPLNVNEIFLLQWTPPPKDSDFRRQILSLVRVLRHWLLFVYIY